MDYLPRRIASLQPSATVTLARLNRLDLVVACTRWCRDVCPEVATSEARVISDSWSAKAEEILACKPDLVIASVPYQLEALAEVLKASVRFVALAPKSIADVYGDIALIARTVGEEERGATLIAEMQREIEAVKSCAARAKTRPRVFCEEWGKPVINSQRWVEELVEAAGGEFIGVAGKQTSVEAVAAADPDVIITSWCGAGDRVPLEKIVAARGWQNLEAVRNGRVYCISDEYLNTPAPTLMAGLKALASAIHPDLFGESAPGLRRIAVAEQMVLR